ncbi:MAG: hypothetical protein HC817_13265 [Saprospiraceae bacterium]|nr:hypothetical protein [Saprospiraceae bacterium]
MLFGEHTVIQGSQALATPLWRFGGTWQEAPDGSARQYDLPTFLLFLKKLKNEEKIELDTEGVERALEKGFFFNSNIPNGYGAGSSGALVAALFAHFNATQLTDYQSDTLIKLRKTFGIIEGYFHGSSSGFDPLVSYLRKPVWVQRDQKIQVLEALKTDLTLFLLDTHTPRKAEPIIKIFQEKLLNAPYKSGVINDLVPRVDDAIAAFLAQQSQILFEAVHHISLFQQRFFPESVPLSFQNIWLEGLRSDTFKLKLCGAGGGGFILGFSRDWQLTKKILSKSGFSAIQITL